jgi:pimeloyl-ACP methyl ester carboxylesterase
VTTSLLTPRQGAIVTAGRRLAFAEYGDPAGRPCLYFHFTPGSRLDPVVVFHHQAELLDGIRLVAIDRPGFGRSERQPGRTFLDWPADVTTVTDHLAIDTFSVLGISGGAGYALACAYAIPERLERVAVVSGMGPLDRPGARHGMTLTNRALYALSHRLPFLAHGLTSALFRGLLVALRRPSGKATTDAGNVWSDPAVRPAIVDDLREAVIRPGTRGLVQELALYARPWNFALEDIVVDIALWHGTRDANVPTALARHVADAIPHGQLHLIDGDHLTPIVHIDHAMNTIRGFRHSHADRHHRSKEASVTNNTSEASPLDDR